MAHETRPRVRRGDRRQVQRAAPRGSPPLPEPLPPRPLRIEPTDPLKETLADILQQVNDALHRMDEGTYGSCQRCGKPIAAARLAAFPYVAYCIECQSILERQQLLSAGA